VLAALRRLGPAAKAAVPNLLAELSRDSPRHDARDVATALGSIGPDAHAALGALDRFPEADSLDRLVFAVARAKIDPARTPAAVSQLFVAAYDTNPDRRMRALTIMSEVDFRPNEVLPVLALLVRDGDIGFAMQSATILTKMGPDAVPVLSAALRQSPPKNRRWIAVALGQMKPPAETAPALIGALADLSDQVRERARDALARMRPPPLRDLRAALTDPDRAKVVEVVRVFGAISPPPEQQVATLAGMLNDPSPAIRSAAIEALGHSARLARPAVPALRPFLKEPGLAEVAAEALFLIDPAGNPDALDVLAAGLRREPTVQTRCYLALRYAGPSAKSCLPAVKAAHDAEQNEHFKAALAKMMEAMAPGSSPPARPAE
jgi:HEAT repeat protein